MKIKEQFPHLYLFFANYFHQDWIEEHESPEEIIKASVNNDGAEDAYRTLHELDQFLALGLPEAELNVAILKDMHCYYTPEPDGISMSRWLHWVRDTLTKYAAEKSAEGKKSQG